jgi:hypothetical protein
MSLSGEEGWDILPERALVGKAGYWSPPCLGLDSAQWAARGGSTEPDDRPEWRRRSEYVDANLIGDLALLPVSQRAISGHVVD